jgi:molybdopterin/thiamine biosynthesis adenylyltransferase/rhodanese-related sulfurtransferase
MPIGRPTAELPSLTPEEMRRYGRHLVLSEIGLEGQRRLKDARVLLVGAGGLGSPAALYLAAAGVGRIGIVDFDAVDATNLQRQVLHGTKDVGRPKVDSARDRLHDLNPHVEVVTHATRLDEENALDLVRGYDVVVDGTDSFAARYLVNDACVLLGRPSVHGAIHRFEGQVSVFCTPAGPCYRCLFPEPPPAGSVPTCAQAGVLGALPGMVGTIQATEVVKLVCGIGEPLVGRLLLVDATTMSFRTMAFARDPRCPACGTRTLTRPTAPAETCELPAAAIQEMTPVELSARRARGDDLVLLDVREPFEWELARIDGARLAPLGRLPDLVPGLGLERGREVVVYCHHGVRSLNGARQLAEAGYTRVWSLAGGIDRWSREVDPKVSRY